MSTDPSDPDNPVRPTPLRLKPENEVKAIRQYQEDQKRVRELMQDRPPRHTNGRDPPPQATPPPQPQTFSARQREAMCALYYSGMSPARIGYRFNTDAATVRAIVKTVKTALALLTACATYLELTVHETEGLCLHCLF